MALDDIVEITNLKVFLCGLPIGFRTAGGYFNSWIRIYWLDNLNTSAASLGLIETLAVPIYFFYFLLFGFYADNHEPKSKKTPLRSAQNINTTPKPRRKYILIFFVVATSLTWYLWLIDPNWILTKYFNSDISFNSTDLGIWFGLGYFIHEISRRSWSVMLSAIVIELTSLHIPYPNDDYRSAMFGTSSIFAYLGGGLAHIIPGYLPTTTFNYLMIMTGITIPFFIFAMIVAFVIREPLIVARPHQNRGAAAALSENGTGGNMNGVLAIAEIDENNAYTEDKNTNKPVLTHLSVWDDDLGDHDISDVNDNGSSHYGVKTSLVATIMRCIRNTPFLIMFGIMLCTRGYFFSDIFIYKYYCKATNQDIATLEIVAYSVRVFSSSFWCYISSKAMNNRNHRYIISAGFVISSISYVLYAFIPYDLE